MRIKPLREYFRYKSDLIGGQVSSVMVGLTQMALLGALLHRVLLTRQSLSQNLDLVLIILFSVLGFAGARIYLGSTLTYGTVLRLGQAYLFLAAVLSVIITLAAGNASPQEWASTWLPIFGAPALILALYAAIAWWNERQNRSESQDEEE